MTAAKGEGWEEDVDVAIKGHTRTSCGNGTLTYTELNV